MSPTSDTNLAPTDCEHRFSAWFLWRCVLYQSRDQQATAEQQQARCSRCGQSYRIQFPPATVKMEITVLLFGLLLGGGLHALLGSFGFPLGPSAVMMVLYMGAMLFLGARRLRTSLQVLGKYDSAVE